MQQLLALISLSWKAAFRYRLFWVLLALLVGAVAGLPVLIKDDGSVEGFTQILLTYTLGAVTAILGLCTLWLACGTLARDIEDCQMQMLAVKPIARWQIWLGKWLGLLTINAALLGLSGLCIYGLLQWRARHLPPEQFARLRNEVLVARASGKEDSFDSKIEIRTEEVLQARMKKRTMEGVDLNMARKQIHDQLRAELEAIPPNGIRIWTNHLGRARESLHGQPLFLRIKFNTLDMSEFGTYDAEFAAGVPQKSKLWQSPLMKFSPNTYHEFAVPSDVLEPNGDLTIWYHNANNVPLVFPLGDCMEVLYREGGFELNLMRALLIILCWMTLLATLGLTAASFLSFPVAAFFSLAILTMVLCSGTLANVVSEGTVMGYNEESGQMGHATVDVVAVPLFKVMLGVIRLAQQFSPIDALSTGRMITWSQVGKAFTQIVLVLGGVLAIWGIFVFNRRELATAQGTS